MVGIFVASILTASHLEPFFVIVVVVAIIVIVFAVKPAPEHTTDGTDAGHRAAVAHAFFQQLVTNLPAENTWILFLILFDPLLDLRSSNARFRAPDDSRSYTTGLLVALEDFTDASVRHPQLAADHTGSNPLRCQFNDFEPNMIWERSSIDKYPSQLVYSSLACKDVEKKKYAIFKILVGSP